MFHCVCISLSFFVPLSTFFLLSLAPTCSALRLCSQTLRLCSCLHCLPIAHSTARRWQVNSLQALHSKQSTKERNNPHRREMSTSSGTSQLRWAEVSWGDQGSFHYSCKTIAELFWVVCGHPIDMSWNSTFRQQTFPPSLIWPIPNDLNSSLMLSQSQPKQCIMKATI